MRDRAIDLTHAAVQGSPNLPRTVLLTGLRRYGGALFQPVDRTTGTGLEANTGPGRAKFIRSRKRKTRSSLKR